MNNPLPHNWLASVILLLSIAMVSMGGCSSQRTLSDSSSKAEPQTPREAAQTIDTNKESITVEGDDVTPEEKKALASAFKHILAEAATNVLNDGFNEMCLKLDISGEAEMALLSAFPKIGEIGQGYGVLSIQLISPGNPILVPKTIELMQDGKPVIRLMRASGPVERPFAIMTYTSVKDGLPSISEWLLTRNDEGKWVSQRSSSRIEHMGK